MTSCEIWDVKEGPLSLWINLSTLNLGITSLRRTFTTSNACSDLVGKALSIWTKSVVAALSSWLESRQSVGFPGLDAELALLRLLLFLAMKIDRKRLG